MKNIFRLLLLFSFYTNAQTIENKYSDFELVTNVKTVTEIKPYSTRVDLFKGFDKVEDFFNNPEVNKIISDKLYFNEKGFISQQEEYYSGDNKTVKEIFLYDDYNKLLEINAEEKEGDGIYIAYYNTKIERNQNEVLKTTTYANEDTIYKEKFILENDLIVEERAPGSDNLREKLTYNDKKLIIKGEIILGSGEKLFWYNSYEYYPNGIIKKKTNIMTDLKSKKTKEFYPNGLLKKTIWNEEILDFEYKYDDKGNWIYKIIYKNNKPNKIYKREITY